MNHIIGIADKKNGEKLKMLCRDKFADAVNSLSEGRYSIEIRKVYNKRSGKQNNSIWGIAYKIIQGCLSEATGENVSLEIVHEFCKERFLPADYVERINQDHKSDDRNTIVNENTGEAITIPFRLTTTKMTTVEGIEYYKKMQKFCAEFFYTEIPDPNPDWKNETL